MSWLRGLDSTGESFTLTGRVSASGHEKRGEIDMTAGSVRLVIYDGVLYGLQAGSSRWLEMGAAQANFLWPAARLSLVWEAILLSSSPSPPFALARDQLAELSGALAAKRGEVLVPPSTTSVSVALDGSRSTFVPTGPDPADVVPPAIATPGDVAGLLAPGTPA